MVQLTKSIFALKPGDSFIFLSRDAVTKHGTKPFVYLGSDQETGTFSFTDVSGVVFDEQGRQNVLVVHPKTVV